jgi:hypothetical protein
MREACLMPKELAAAYSEECLALAGRKKMRSGKGELLQMAENLQRFPGNRLKISGRQCRPSGLPTCL